jgi:hypothetical protein
MQSELWALIKNHRPFFGVITAVLIVVVILSAWVILTGCDSIDAICIKKNKDIITGTGAFIAAIAGLSAWMITQWRESDRRRVETFFKLRNEFRKNKRFGKIFQALDGDITKITLRRIKSDDAAEFASFIEEIAILVQSGVIPPSLAHYFFGYYAIKIVDNSQFMKKIQSDDDDPLYWSLLQHFASVMKAERCKLRKDLKGIAQLRV